MENKNGSERKFVLQVLPWLIGAAAFGVYLVTLNHWVSLFNTGAVARLAGWQWYSELNRPVYFLVTYPLHWLPVSWLPLALNLFSALCGALAVGQLARSVALLPHDRTQDQRLREQSADSRLSLPLAWLPPVLAAAACLLQHTVWDHATNGSAVILNLLLFSYVVRVLLEYRNDGREARLPRLAFIYGIDMANDTAMIGFFPLFLMELWWLRGIAFFNFKFLLRMTLYGLAGLSLFLLLPYLAGRAEFQSIDFWHALKTNFLTQKSMLVLFPKRTFTVLALTSIVPVLFLSIRWAAGFGDNSALGTALTNFIFHIVHAMFLFACTWTVFDSSFSPRERGMGYPFLPFYFLAALSIGYYSGYFLLVFRKVASERPSWLLKSMHWATTVIVVALLIVVPAGLIARNLGDMRTSNGPLLKQYAATMAAGFPPRGVLLSDDQYHMVLALSTLGHAEEKNYIPLDTHSLTYPGYHRYLEHRYGPAWPEKTDKLRKALYTSVEENVLLVKLAETNEVYYLHPSFGGFFEVFYQVPRGPVYQLERFDTNVILRPQLAAEVVQENQAFWAKVISTELPPLLKDIKPRPPEEKPALRDQLWKKLRLVTEPNPIEKLLGTFYGRMLTVWGVEMQRRNDLKSAHDYFQTVLELDPDNVVAEINLECNKNLSAGITPAVKVNKSIEDLFGKYRSWDQVMNRNGPYDEPSFCYAAGYQFSQSGMYRQAAGEFDRVKTFSPDILVIRLLLIQIDLIVRQPDMALAALKELRAQPKRFKLDETNQTTLSELEASAYFIHKETNTGNRILEAAMDGITNNDPRMFDGIFKVYWSCGMYSNGLATLDRELAMRPDDVTTLVDQGYAYCGLKQFSNAIPFLTRALNVESNNPTALFNRAIAYLGEAKYDEAIADYKQLQEIYPDSRRIYFGLAEIAMKKKDTNAAIENYELYLSNAVPGSAEARLVKKRLLDLNGGKDPNNDDD